MEKKMRIGHLSFPSGLPVSHRHPTVARCDCGKEISIRPATAYARYLRSTSPVSCGCKGNSQYEGVVKRLPDHSALVGQEFGRLTVTSIQVVRTDNGKLRQSVVAACACGGQWVGPAYRLLRGITTSCGCFHLERQVETGEQTLRHGHAGHGCLYPRKADNPYTGLTPVYVRWVAIRSKCKNNVHPTTCSEYDPAWDVFENFLADVGEFGPEMTVSRIDNQLPWGKENVRVVKGRRKGFSPILASEAV